MTAMTLPSPPELDIARFQITESTEYFWPEIWNAKIEWLQAWHDYLVAQAAFYQQAIAAAGSQLREEMQAHLNQMYAAIDEAQRQIEQHRNQAVLAVNSAVDQIDMLRQQIAQDAATVAAGLAAVNMPAATSQDSGSLLALQGDRYVLLRPLYRPPPF